VQRRRGHCEPGNARLRRAEGETDVEKPLFITVRARPSTHRQWRACRRLAAAVNDRTTADRVLDRALSNLRRRLKSELRAHGIDYREVLATPGESSDHRVIPDFDVRPPADGLGDARATG
jgi:hypothetical protein